MDDDVVSMRVDAARSTAVSEVRFWVRILKEHALFIQMGLPSNRPDLIAEARRFYELFGRLQDAVDARPTLDNALLTEIRQAVAALIEFKRHLVRLSVQCELPGSGLYPLLLAHVIREAEHFLAFLDSGCRVPIPGGLLGVMQNESFWLRQMKEHIEFILGLLDPSERELLSEAHAQSAVFSRLLETARDLESMAESSPQKFGTAVQFTETLIARVTALRDFKAAGYELAVLCRLLSITVPLLLDHVRREADKFLEELQEMRQVLCRWDPGRRPM